MTMVLRGRSIEYLLLNAFIVPDLPPCEHGIPATVSMGQRGDPENFAARKSKVSAFYR